MRAIDADEFEKVIEAWIRMHWGEAFTGDDVGSDFLEMLDEEPTLDVKPVVHAHWIYSGSYDEVGMLYCSCCKHEIDVSEGYFKYCPHCGAKMDEEEGK